MVIFVIIVIWKLHHYGVTRKKPHLRILKVSLLSNVHLLSNSWSDVAVTSQNLVQRVREGRQGRDREWSKWPAKHRTYALVCAKASQKPRSKSVLVWDKNWVSSDWQLFKPKNVQMFYKTIWLSKLRPTETAFLCWMSNGIWSIPYPKLWQVTQRWFCKQLHVYFLHETDWRKFWQDPRVAFIWSFPLLQEQNLSNLSWDLSKHLSPLFQTGHDALNCCTAAITQLQHDYFAVAETCFKQTQLIQREMQQHRKTQQRRCWQDFTISRFVLQNTRSFCSIKKDCWTKSLPDHKYKKNKG